MSSSMKIVRTPEWDALNAFDAQHNLRPAREMAEEIALRFGHGPKHQIVDEIANAIEDAHEIGMKRQPFVAAALASTATPTKQVS